MEFVIWVETRIAGRTVDRQEVAKIELARRASSILPIRTPRSASMKVRPAFRHRLPLGSRRIG
jgi:hypothetical protein